MSLEKEKKNTDAVFFCTVLKRVLQDRADIMGGRINYRIFFALCVADQVDRIDEIGIRPV
jgi:hypothetical protein